MTEQTKKIREAVKLLSTFTEEEWKRFDKAITKMNVANSNENMEKVVTDMLKKFRIPPHVIGYKYLREAIIWKINNPGNCAITKDIYPMIAEKFHTTPVRVERAIRHAIQFSYCENDKLIYEEILRITRSPTNSYFIYGIADYIKTYMM